MKVFLLCLSVLSASLQATERYTAATAVKDTVVQIAVLICFAHSEAQREKWFKETIGLLEGQRQAAIRHLAEKHSSDGTAAFLAHLLYVRNTNLGVQQLKFSKHKLHEEGMLPLPFMRVISDSNFSRAVLSLDWKPLVR